MGEIKTYVTPMTDKKSFDFIYIRFHLNGMNKFDLVPRGLPPILQCFIDIVFRQMVGGLLHVTSFPINTDIRNSVAFHLVQDSSNRIGTRRASQPNLEYVSWHDG